MILNIQNMGAAVKRAKNKIGDRAVPVRSRFYESYATQSALIVTRPVPSRGGGEESLRVLGMVRQSVSQIIASEARKGRKPGASCSNSSRSIR